MSAMKEESSIQSQGKASRISARYVLCAMCFLGITFQYTVKVSLSVAIVAMIKSTTVTESQKLHNIMQAALTNNVSAEELDTCPGLSEDESGSEDGEFDWSEETQGYVLSSYYYGYVATQLLGGRLSEIFGSKIILGPGVLISGILSLLSPLAARLDVGVFIAVRALIGAAAGVIIPSTHVIFSKWYPLEERTSLSSVIMAAIPVGTIISFGLSGLMANKFGWPFVYYFFGGISVAWFLPWMFLVYDTPEKHPRVSEEEKNNIMTSLGQQKNEKVSYPVPLFAMLTSLPLWAHISMGVGYAWIGTTLLTELPTFLSSILHFDITKSGAIAAIPFVFVPISGVFFGFLSQWLRGKRYLSHLTTYRIFNAICSIGVAIFLLVITQIGCSTKAIVAVLILGMIVSGAYSGGSLMNNLDLGSNFAGTASGISHTVTNIMGIITPMIVGALTNGKQTLTQWHIVFYIAMGVMIFTYLVFLTFGSVDEQPWNRPQTQDIKLEESPDTHKGVEDV